jgi:hypothetical protein
MKTLGTKIKAIFNKYTFMKWLVPILVIAIVATAAVLPTACSKKTNKTESATKLSFKSAVEYDYLKMLDGELVTINGYMATSSPVDGSFMFLMNLPYQSCPFCVPNTSQLSNTMEVYPKKGEKFDYTTQAIKIVGTLDVADNEDEPFTDKYGYEFNYKIVDATYSVLSQNELDGNVALWQEISSSGIINEIDKMYNYVNFLCSWNTYFINSYKNENGEIVPGYFLYASDAKNYIEKDGAQWNYGYRDGYFDGIVNKIREIDDTELEDLVANVRNAEALANKALNELNSGNYTYEYQYVEKFDNYDYIYTLNKGEELSEEFSLTYMEFSNWLGNWEM